MKSPLRKTYASGSTRRLVEKMIELGWHPDRRDVLPRRGRHLNVAWSTAIADFNAPVNLRRNSNNT